jgi:hypothetical protein
MMGRIVLMRFDAEETAPYCASERHISFAPVTPHRTAPLPHLHTLVPLPSQTRDHDHVSPCKIGLGTGDG